MRKMFIAGNWKMYKNLTEAKSLANGLRRELNSQKWANAEVLVCPPFTVLFTVHEILQACGIQLGAQNCHAQSEGAFTGEISPMMLKDVGCTHVIVGHSERRQYYHETNEEINEKVKSVIEHELNAIVCIGESLLHRDDGKTMEVLEQQLKGSLMEVTARQLQGSVTIAYEPVWAIGTGRTASPEQAEEAHAFIRGVIAKMHDQETADTVRILYGGSVKPENATDLLIQPNVDGALIGGASLRVDSFSDIVMKGCEIRK